MEDFDEWGKQPLLCFLFQKMGAGAFVGHINCPFAAGSPRGGAPARPAPAPPSSEDFLGFSDSSAALCFTP